MLNDAQPIQALIGKLAIDLGDLLPETSASALIDASCLAEKEEYFRIEERVHARNMRGSSLGGITTMASQLEGIHKGFTEAYGSLKSTRCEAKQADREVAELEQRMAKLGQRRTDATNRATLAHEKVNRCQGNTLTYYLPPRRSQGTLKLTKSSFTR